MTEQNQKSDVWQGTMALMVLKTLESMGPLHGYGIARRIEQISGDRLSLNYGSIYPALLRLEQERAIVSEWGTSENNRKAKFYRLTAAGRKQLKQENAAWQEASAIVARFLSAKESVRETSRLLWLETAARDVRYALRGLRLNPGFATTAVLSLTLGIGASVAIYTVADNLLLRPLPYPDAKQLVMLYEMNPHRDSKRNVISPANYFDWKAQSSSFSAIGGFFDFHIILGDGKRTEEVDAQAVSGEVLPALQVKPIRGRVFTMQEDKDDAHVAVISYRLWQEWFGGR